jgi:hypothetical protein
VATSLDLEIGSSSGSDARIWLYTETKYLSLEISPFYIKNTFKVYVKCKMVKPVTKRPKDV